LLSFLLLKLRLQFTPRPLVEGTTARTLRLPPSSLNSPPRVDQLRLALTENPSGSLGIGVTVQRVDKLGATETRRALGGGNDNGHTRVAVALAILTREAQPLDLPSVIVQRERPREQASVATPEWGARA
jgi:hypothetical protein